MQGISTFMGRLCLAAVFGWSALVMVQHWPARVQDVLTRVDVAAIAGHVLVGGATALLILGTLALALGLMTRWGALLLMFFLIPATMLFHDFWNYVGEARTEPMMHFYKNVGLFGGLAVLLGRGAGTWGFDQLRLKRRQRQAAEHASRREAQRVI